MHMTLTINTLLSCTVARIYMYSQTILNRYANQIASMSWKYRIYHIKAKKAVIYSFRYQIQVFLSQSII